MLRAGDRRVDDSQASGLRSLRPRRGSGSGWYTSYGQTGIRAGKQRAGLHKGIKQETRRAVRGPLRGGDI